MNLWDLKKSHQAIIRSISNTISYELKARLKDIGFCEGQLITAISHSPFKGTIILQVQDSIFSIEKKLAQQVYISPESDHRDSIDTNQDQKKGP